jgi:hypothetical protein
VCERRVGKVVGSTYVHARISSDINGLEGVYRGGKSADVRSAPVRSVRGPPGWGSILAVPLLDKHPHILITAFAHLIGASRKI